MSQAKYPESYPCHKQNIRNHTHVTSKISGIIHMSQAICPESYPCHKQTIRNHTHVTSEISGIIRTSQAKYPESYQCNKQNIRNHTHVTSKISGITPQQPAKYPESHPSNQKNIRNHTEDSGKISEDTNPACRKTSRHPGLRISHDQTISVASATVVRTATFADTAGVMTELRVAQSRSQCYIPGREEIFSSTERPDRLWGPQPPVQ
jgi:hypothetical protein